MADPPPPKPTSDLFDLIPQSTWNSYYGFRTFNQRNTSGSAPSSSETCECCAPVRRALVSSALAGTLIVWLVDAKLLHDVSGRPQQRKGEPSGEQCGFCRIIYQQFWAWRDASYRLISLLWAKQVRELEVTGSLEKDVLQQLWRETAGRFDPETAEHFRSARTYSVGDCAVKTCNFCQQDNTAVLPFGDIESVCPPCRKTLDTFGELGNSLCPVIPLALKPELTTQGSRLRVVHGAGVTLHEEGRPEWVWKLYTLPDDNAAKFIPPYHRASYDHEGVYAQVKEWMAQCSTHDLCQARRPARSRMPTRILDVGGDRVKLKECSSDEEGEYIALSYCWGAPQPFSLTKANHAEYQESIDIEILPKTVRDAIRFVRALDFRYMWIDSLAVIQDDEADKLREFGRMHQVYRNSSLTLSAMGAHTCTEGFFDVATIPGTSVRMPDTGINYPCELPDGTIGHVRLAERAEYRTGAEPLSSRAWAYQENLLPIRLVQFGACLSWECETLSERKTLTSLTGGIDAEIPFSWLFDRADSTQQRLRRVLHGLKQADLSSPPTNGQDLHFAKACPVQAADLPNAVVDKCICEDGAFFAAWQLAVYNFTERQLSDHSDKLPAFAGLAQAFGLIREDQYVAGLWRRRLLHELMWTTELGGHPGVKFGEERYLDRAPSWSWASVDAPIKSVGAHKRIITCHLERAELVRQVETSSVEDCGVELRDPDNQYGPIKSAFVTINGPMVKARLMKGRLQSVLRIKGVQLTPTGSTGAMMSEPGDFASPCLDLIFPQAPDLEGYGTVKDGLDVWCLQMREETVRSKTMGDRESGPKTIKLLDGLILLPSEPGSTTFRRIGAWVTDWTVVVDDDQHPFRNVASSIVTIV